MTKWYTEAVQRLQEGKSVTVRPYGHSMEPLVRSGEVVTLEPCTSHTVKTGDIVLCKVHGKHYLHLVKATAFGTALIANNKGNINGWTQTIYGKKI
jgi:phage repressor protein C with HTH and peptisase S24 domain